MDSPQVFLPGDTRTSLYVGFRPTPERVAAGAKVTACARCSAWVGHKPQESVGTEIVCLKCANDVPAIREHMDAISKGRE